MRYNRAGKTPLPTLPVAAPDVRETTSQMHQGSALEADRLRKRKAAVGKFALAQDALAQWQAQHPAAGIEDWCAQHFATPFLHQWQAPRYIRDFMRVAYDAPADVRQVFLHKAAQLGFTSALQGILAFGVARGRRHVVCAQPTTQDATEFRRDSVTPLFDGIEELSMLAATVRGDQSTTSHRVFEASSVRIQGGLKPGRWRRFVADLLLIDERDAMPLSASAGADEDGEGDVVALAMRATQNRAGRLVAGGTPTSAMGASRIVAEARDAELSLCFVLPCPSCGAEDDLAWERLRWPDDAPSKAAAAAAVEHHCSHCGAGWTHDKLAVAIEGGRWRESDWPEGSPWPAPVPAGRWLDAAKPCIRDADGAEQPWPRSLGLAVWGGYSPWRPWPELVAAWLSCQGNPAKMQAFTEQQLARPWRRATESVDETTLQSKRQHVALVDGLPAEAQHCIIAIDVQKDWLCCLTTAWARPDRGWVLDRREFHGGIIDAEGAWSAWAAWMVEHWSACRVRIDVAVDVGYSQSVVLASIRTLSMQRRLPRRGVQYIPCKGSSQGFDAPVFKRTRQPPRLAIIGHQVKRWQMQAMDAGRVVLADTLDDACLRELAAEEVRQTKRGKAQIVATGANESADCLTYAAAIWLGRMGNTLR